MALSSITLGPATSEEVMNTQQSKLAMNKPPAKLLSSPSWKAEQDSLPYNFVTFKYKYTSSAGVGIISAVWHAKGRVGLKFFELHG